MRKYVSIIIMIILFLNLFTVTARAESFVYNDEYYWPIPEAYEHIRTITKVEDSKKGTFSKPEDFCISDGYIYILDTGNARVVKMTLTGKTVRIYSAFGETGLNSPRGIFVIDEAIFIADTGNARVVHIDQSGDLVEVFDRPDSLLLDTTTYPYRPVKVAVDSLGCLNVISDGDFHGIISIDGQNEFRGYLGTNKVRFSLANFIARYIATPEQKQQLSRNIPPYFTSLYIGNDNFYYTTTALDNTTQIKKLNAVGKNIYYDEFGKLSKRYGFGDSYFIDLVVDKTGIVTSVDSKNAYVFQFDQECNNICVFGGKGNVEGRFEYPVAVDIDTDRNLYVLDRDRGNIQVFRETDFIKHVHDATDLFYNGRYADAEELWDQVLQYNRTYLLAYRQIGKAAYKQEDWVKSMEYYKKGKDKNGYSKAFSELRNDYVKTGFVWIVLLICITLYFVYRFVIWLRKLAVNQTY